MIPQSKLVLFLSSSLLLSSFSFAAEKSPKPRDERFDDQLEFAKPSLSSANPQVSDKRKDKHTLSITKEELSKHPDLIVRGLITAVSQNNGEAVQLLLPLYQNLSKQDPFLLEWANAIKCSRRKAFFGGSNSLSYAIFSRFDHSTVTLSVSTSSLFNNDNEAAKGSIPKTES